MHVRNIFNKNKLLLKKQYLILLINIIFLIFILLVSFNYAKGSDKWRIISAIPSPIRVAGRIVLREFRDLPYLRYRFANHNLPIYNLAVGQKDLNFLNTNLPEDPFLLTKEFKEYVNAVFKYKDINYDAKVRYRGLYRSHWLWPKKSLRVKFDKDNFFDKKEKINLIIPSDRLYLIEEVNNWQAKRLGLIVPDSKFVVVEINDKNPAVYWEVEQFGKSFLEKNNLSGDASLFAEDKFPDVGISIYDELEYWKKFTHDPRFGKKDYSLLSSLFSVLGESNNEDFYNKIFSILDEDNFYKWSIHSALVKSSHQDWSHNMRLYFDPSLGKFKIIPWDVGLGSDGDFISIPDSIEDIENPFLLKMFQNSEILNKRNQLLWDYLKDGKNLDELLLYYDKLYNDVQTAFYQDRIHRFNIKDFDEEVFKYRNILEDQYSALKSLFEVVEFSSEVNLSDEKKISSVSFTTKSLSPILLNKVHINYTGSDVFTNTILITNSDNKIFCNKIGERNINGEKSVQFSCVENNVILANTKILPNIEKVGDNIVEERFYNKIKLEKQENILYIDDINKIGMEEIIFNIKNINTGEDLEYKIIL